MRIHAYPDPQPWSQGSKSAPFGMRNPKIDKQYCIIIITQKIRIGAGTLVLVAETYNVSLSLKLNSCTIKLQNIYQCCGIGTF